MISNTFPQAAGHHNSFEHASLRVSLCHNTNEIKQKYIRATNEYRCWNDKNLIYHSTENLKILENNMQTL